MLGITEAAAASVRLSSVIPPARTRLPVEAKSPSPDPSAVDPGSKPRELGSLENELRLIALSTHLGAVRWHVSCENV